MRTDDLIQLLSADQNARARSLPRSFLLLLLSGLMVCVLLFWFLFDVRDDIATAALEPRFQFKLAAMLVLAVSAAMLALRVATPVAAAGAAAWSILVAPALLLVALTVELALLPSREWTDALLGTNWLACVVGIGALALPLLAVSLLALRQGAPARPAAAGAVAGLLAGAMAASLYAGHCPDDSPLFVVAWYGLAIGMVTLLGAGLGARLLRW